jgi:CheY-like chemotaxis protein
MSDITNSPSILLVEDNQDDIDLTMYAFSKANFINPIEVCRDGVEVIERMADWDRGIEKPLCILLDINTPRISGLEVLGLLKQKFPTIPVIMLTSSKEPVDIEKAYQLGANSYIVKPIGLDKFIEVARQIKLYWVVLNMPGAG